MHIYAEYLGNHCSDIVDTQLLCACPVLISALVICNSAFRCACNLDILCRFLDLPDLLPGIVRLRIKRTSFHGLVHLLEVQHLLRTFFLFF